MTERHFIPLASPFDVALDGTRLVEAGAGTGKTWTITALVLRLLLEQQLEIGQILVVTYTRAATGELRGRIRQRLAEALAAFEGGGSGDAYLCDLVARHEAGMACARLRLAIESFDEAAIHTIHGFCQRALAETAFEAGQSFERELLADQRELLAAVARDAWRRLLADASENWARWLIDRFAGPDGLAGMVAAHLGRIDARLAAPEAVDREAAAAEFAVAHAMARDLWLADREAILDRLAGAKLNQQSYKPDRMRPRIAALDAYFSHEMAALPLPADADHFGLAKIIAKLNKGAAAPEHAFFAVMDALLAAASGLAAAYERATRRLVHDFLVAARADLTERKRRSGRQAYDDLLIDLARALEGPGGAALAAGLRLRYRAALVDEFQDTDPLQLGIFSGIFGGTLGGTLGGTFGAQDRPLVFVGDPKQAIYGFRSADVFAYLAARAQAGAGYALLENRRSDPPLLTALNALFERQRPFLLDALPFDAALPAAMTRETCAIDDGAAPFALWTLRKPEEARGFSKEAAEELVSAAVAGDIARLLALAAQGRASIGGRPLGGGDIAVLVRKRAQGESVRAALARHGIPSVAMGGGSVWHSEEAEEVERLLLAVAAPAREGLVRAALATVLLGADAAQLAAWAEDDAGWSARLDLFHDDLGELRERGFMAMWRRLLRREGVVPRVLARPDGERRMTNYRHLAELLQAAEHAGGLDAAGLARHIAQARAAAESEETQLRLESDAQLVRIVTIHAAKGLQYPIVYCPFLWGGGRADETGWPVLAHEEAGACLDFGSPGIDALRRRADLESAAEELRLAYVALTRAQHRCVVAWGKVNQFERSPLAWLLFGPREGTADDPRTLLAARLEKLDASAMQAELAQLAAGLGGALAVVPLPAAEMQVVPKTGAGAGVRPLAPRVFAGAIPAPWRVSSFSSLAARLAEEEESADRDAMPPAASAVPSAPTFAAVERPAFASLFDFPRGARAGSCLHALFERIDFQRRGDDAAQATAVLDEFGFPAAWQPVLARMLADVVAAPLNDAGLRLADVAREARLIELEFAFPLAAAGYMKGFIDLVFCHEGRWYIVDYKSNWLGDQAADYDPAPLAEAMRTHRYDLQLLIYAAALKRALALREPGLDWPQCFGGVFYLFLRGMAPGSQNGVYFARPDDAAIDGFLDETQA
jgi:exodeoxyribonuclease V beta subunit